MVKAGYSAYGPVKTKVAGKEKGYGFMETSVYMTGQTRKPTDRAWPRREELTMTPTVTASRVTAREDALRYSDHTGDYLEIAQGQARTDPRGSDAAESDAW
jgi:hypothetical protein